MDVEVAVVVGVGVDCTNQLVLFPLSVEFEGLITVALKLFESFTSRNVTFFVLLGSIFHCVPAVVLLNFIKFPEEPVRVKIPEIVCVFDVSKLNCLPARLHLKFINVLSLFMVAAVEPVNSTVPLVPPLYVPVFVQLPPRFIDPVLAFKAPALVMLPSVTFNVPSLTLNVLPVSVVKPAAYKRVVLISV